MGQLASALVSVALGVWMTFLLGSRTRARTRGRVRELAQVTSDGTRRESRRFGRRSAGTGAEGSRADDGDGLWSLTTVAPEPDGRPGFEVAVPGQPRWPGIFRPDGTRADVTVQVERDATIVVKSLGRVGRSTDDGPILDAEHRPDAVRSQSPPSWTYLGEPARVETGAGTGWRTTLVVGALVMVADTHIDRDGWAWVVGVSAPPWLHADVALVADAMLGSWHWIDPPTGGHQG